MANVFKEYGFVEKKEYLCYNFSIDSIEEELFDVSNETDDKR